MSVKKEYAAIGALAGALALGTVENAYAQRTERYGNSSIQSIKLNTDSSSMDLSAAGDGTIGKPYIIPLTLSPESNLSFDVTSRGRPYIEVADAGNALAAIARNRRVRTPEENYFRRYLNDLRGRVSGNDAESIARLNRALEDRTINPTDSLYDYSTGSWKIKEGVYMMMVESRDENDRIIGSVPIFLDLKLIPPRANTYTESEVDSILRESRRISERRISDSIRDAQSKTQGQVEQTGSHERHEERRAVEVGVGAGYGLDQKADAEAYGEAFVNAQVVPGLRLEAFGDYNLTKENPYSTGTSQDTTVRESQLIGTDPDTHKDRTDVRTTSGNARGIAGFGGRIVVQPFTWLDLALGAGEKIIRGTKNIEEKSTISFRRFDPQLGYDTQLGPNQVILNSLENKVSDTQLLLSAGARFNVNRNLYFGLGYERTGLRNGQNRGKISVGLKF